jgi:hypothetical protein
MTNQEPRQHPGDGQPLQLDPEAEARTPGRPAFLSRPPEAPVYHGFVVLDAVEVEGFRLGVITPFLGLGGGDAFVVAPDDTRCGLVWKVSPDPLFEQLRPPEADRWGVYAVSIPTVVNTMGEAREALAALFPRLRDRWLTWREQFGAKG